ncbi:hypothetical protein [Polymorphospora lycopeni]|uniref:Uncharacterized protein n=1 Tax=Polymorphospora lycopeni TaxID=3140240 RepID=A0ABV5CSG1_9ACTN
MAEDGGGGVHNPYGEQTRANTSRTWLDGQEPLDVDIDGLVDYGKDMKTIEENLNGLTPRLNLLGSLPASAWTGNVLPEGAYAMSQMTANYGELQQYLLFLGTALNNIGMAAQTVADAYSSTDGWSAASLDSVLFAFGDSRAERPAGLPPWVTGETWFDAYSKAIQEGTGEYTAGESFNGPTEITHNPDGSTTTSTVGSAGTTRSITEFNIPGGGTMTTIVVTGANGEVISRSSSRTNGYATADGYVTTQTSYDGNGNVTGSETTTSRYGSDGSQSTTVTRSNADGAVTSTNTDSTNAAGVQTITSADGQGNETQRVVIGEQTEGVEGTPESPGAEALEEIQDRNYLPSW